MKKIIIIPPEGMKSYDFTFNQGAWIAIEVNNTSVTNIQRYILIYILDDADYNGFTGTNNTLSEMIREAHVAAWLASTENSMNVIYFDRVDHDSQYHVILENNPPAFSTSYPKTIDLSIKVRAPYPTLSYLAAIPITIALTLYLSNLRKTHK